MKDFSQIKRVLKDMIDFFEDFSLFEQKKLDAIVANDTAMLEEHMKEEQAYSMKMKGLDKKREQAILEQGYTNDSLKEIIKNPTSDEERELAEVYNLLSEKLQEFKENSRQIKEQIDTKLFGIKVLLERLEDHYNKETYTKDAQQKHNNNTTTFKTQKV